MVCIAQGREYGTIKNAQYVTCYDGDTCRFNIPGLHPIIGDNVSIRFNGIDTPEIRGKCKIEKDLAKQARDKVRSILNQSSVIELRNIQRGKYFRIVADLWVDGKSVNTLLINSGLAVAYDGGTKFKDWCR